MIERYFVMINIILITTLVGLSTGTFYRVVKTAIGDPAPQVSRPASVKPVQAMDNQKKPFDAYSNVVRRNLFKVSAEPVKINNSVDPSSLDPVTSLSLALWGTISGGGTLAWAIIEDTKTREQLLYKVGDTIQGATLTHVFRNKVVLNVNGVDKVLEVKDDEGLPGGAGSGPTFPSGPFMGNPNRIIVPSAAIDESLKDINTLMKDVRIRPHFNDGAADGLIISGIRGDSLFKQLGLRNGDIIQGVDGSKIQSVDDAMKLYTGIKNKQKMKVDIKRRGQVQTLDFDIK